MNVYNFKERRIIDTMFTFLAIEFRQQKSFWHKFNLYVLQSVGRLKQDRKSKQNWKYPPNSARPSIDLNIDTLIVPWVSSMFLHVCNSLNLNEICFIYIGKINQIFSIIYCIQYKNSHNYKAFWQRHTCSKKQYLRIYFTSMV